MLLEGFIGSPCKYKFTWLLDFFLFYFIIASIFHDNLPQLISQQFFLLFFNNLKIIFREKKKKDEKPKRRVWSIQTRTYEWEFKVKMKMLCEIANNNNEGRINYLLLCSLSLALSRFGIFHTYVYAYMGIVGGSHFRWLNIAWWFSLTFFFNDHLTHFLSLLNIRSHIK